MKLSYLREDLLLVDERGEVLTVKEVREMEDAENRKWYVAQKEELTIDVWKMIERYLDDKHVAHQNHQWLEKAVNCLKGEEIREIETILQRAFERDEKVKTYHVRGEKVEID